jgi:hypothetical protein
MKTYGVFGGVAPNIPTSVSGAIHALGEISLSIHCVAHPQERRTLSVLAGN